MYRWLKKKQATAFGVLGIIFLNVASCGIDKNGNVLGLQESAHLKSNYAVVAFHPNKVVKIAKNSKPSARGELEITTVTQCFLDTKELKLSFRMLAFGLVTQLTASNFIEVIEKVTRG